MNDVEIGSQITHYRVVRRFGAGGMGAVFLAQDLTLDRPVAIKFLAASDDAHSRKRLLREAQAVAALDHECIAAESPDMPLPDAVVSGKEPFLVIGAIAGG